MSLVDEMRVLQAQDAPRPEPEDDPPPPEATPEPEVLAESPSDPPPPAGFTEPPQNLTEPAPEEPASFYAGRYKTREEVEKALLEREQTITRLNNEKNEATRAIQERQRVIDTFMEQPRQLAPALDPEPPMPDPVADPEAYRVWLQGARERDRLIAVQEFEQRAIAQQSAQRRIDAIWSYFQVQYPDLAQHTAVVGEAWQAVAGREIPHNPFPVIEKVAEIVRQRIGGQPSPPPAPPPEPPPPPARIVAEPTPGRTAVTGGSARRPAAPKKTEAAPTIGGAITDWQKSAGLI